MAKPSAVDLWRQAGGGTNAYSAEEYRRLMLEHGLLVPLAPGEVAEPLPCGWPKRRRSADPGELMEEPDLYPTSGGE